MRSLEQFFLTVGQNNFGNKIPFFLKFADPITEAPSTNSNSTGGNDTDSGTADQVGAD